MIGAVHVALGAAAGALCPSRTSAFLAGLSSHALADAAPHKDFPPVIEVPLVLGALAALGKWRGFDSTEFWGAIGGIVPDAEHALLETGLIAAEDEVFPTHAENGRLHGPETGARWGQALVVAASLAVIVWVSAPARSNSAV